MDTTRSFRAELIDVARAGNTAMRALESLFYKVDDAGAVVLDPARHLAMLSPDERREFTAGLQWVADWYGRCAAAFADTRRYPDRPAAGHGRHG